MVLRFPVVFGPAHATQGRSGRSSVSSSAVLVPSSQRVLCFSFVGERNEGGLLSRREPEVYDWVSPSPCCLLVAVGAATLDI